MWWVQNSSYPVVVYVQIIYVQGWFMSKVYMSSGGSCPNNTYAAVVHIQIINMSNGGLCPNNTYLVVVHVQIIYTCPVVVYVPVIYVQQWDDQFINIYVH